jgi:phosphinothricin acetyltransferase
MGPRLRETRWEDRNFTPVILRFVSLRDAEEIAAIYAPIVETTAISFEAVAPDAAEMRSRIGSHPADKPWIVAENEGAISGYAYASTFRGRPAYRFGAEVTVYVAERARRGGVGRALYRALMQLLTSQGYRRAFAGIALPNDGSVALHHAAGFTDAGVVHAAGFKFGRWHDVGFYECALAPLDVPPHDPVEVTALDLEVIRAAFAP